MNTVQEALLELHEIKKSSYKFWAATDNDGKTHLFVGDKPTFLFDKYWMNNSEIFYEIPYSILKIEMGTCKQITIVKHD
jgi:hypothetical protein